MKIGLIDVDCNNFPDLPLMKISAYHKARGDDVEFVMPIEYKHYDKVYMSKVFSFTPDYQYHVNADEVIKGGTGYAIELVDGREVYHPEADKALPDEIEHMMPDYSIYIYIYIKYSIWFLNKRMPERLQFLSCCCEGKADAAGRLRICQNSGTGRKI